MKLRAFKKSLLSLAALPAAVLLSSARAAAQCAMCYASAAAAGSKGIHALKVGILVMAIPTFTIFGGLLLAAYRRRNPSWPVEPREEPTLVALDDSLVPLHPLK